MKQMCAIKSADCQYVVLFFREVAVVPRRCRNGGPHGILPGVEEQRSFARLPTRSGFGPRCRLGVHQRGQGESHAVVSRTKGVRPMSAPLLPFPPAFPGSAKNGNGVKLFSQMTEHNAFFAIANDPTVGNTLCQNLGFGLGAKLGDIEVLLRAVCRASHDGDGQKALRQREAAFVGCGGNANMTAR